MTLIQQTLKFTSDIVLFARRLLTLKSLSLEDLEVVYFLLVSIFILRTLSFNILKKKGTFCLDCRNFNEILFQQELITDQILNDSMILVILLNVCYMQACLLT